MENVTEARKHCEIAGEDCTLAGEEWSEDSSDVIWDHNSIVKTYREKAAEKYRGKLCVCERGWKMLLKLENIVKLQGRLCACRRGEKTAVMSCGTITA